MSPTEVTDSSPEQPEPQEQEAKKRFNLTLRTLGGRGLWKDVMVKRGWRIQEHAVTGHARLLNPENVRHAWGTIDACHRAFEGKITVELGPSQQRHAVMVLHGLFNSRHSMRKISRALSDDGYHVLAASYPTTFQGVDEHADQIEQILNSLEGVDTVSFVTHSLGGLVAREILSRDSEWKERMKTGRLVMIGTPNRGSSMANFFNQNPIYQWVVGQSGQDLTLRGTRDIPLPEIEFGVIAGGSGKRWGFNPLLKGDNDGVVRTTETRLPGQADFLVVPAMHNSIKWSQDTIRATKHFLKTGRFSEEQIDSTET